MIGTLYSDFHFPWIDGWNERGHVHVEQVIRGKAHPGVDLPFAWERDFRQGWCMTRPDWRGDEGKRKIWILTNRGAYYRAEMWGWSMDRLSELLDGLRATEHAK